MSNKHNSSGTCHYIPAYIFKHILESEAAPEVVRQAALRTLSTDQNFREQREQALHAAPVASAADDTGVLAAQAPIVSSGSVPPYVLEHIAQSEATGDEARESARATLRTDSKIREQRVALISPAATDEPHDASTYPLQLRRLIHDAKGTGNLPGALVRAEGAARIQDRQVNNLYDAVGITLKFFHTVFGRNSIDNQGRSIVATVHFDNQPQNPLGYNNAFWDGKQCAFGDGDGIIFDYFTDSLDVVAHELTHAITQFTASLVYSKQSGGLNESISDVFAAMVEQWHFKQTAADADWLTGQNLFPVDIRGSALRNIAHPGTAFNDPILGRDLQVSHFSQYNDTLDVHITSGIPNRAFYLAAIGLGSYSWEKAGKIWYATLTDKRIKPNCTFKQWADVTVEHAQNLFGTSESKIIRQAWVNVGVFDAITETAKNEGETALQDVVESHLPDVTQVGEMPVKEVAENNGQSRVDNAVRFNSDDTILKRWAHTFVDKSSDDFYWDGLDTYKKCKGNMGESLTILRTENQGQCFVARSLSEMLSEFYPNFGLKILNWLTEICGQAQKQECNQISQATLFQAYKHVRQGTYTVLSESTPTESTHFTSIQPLEAEHPTIAKLEGSLYGEILSWTLSSNSKEFLLKVRAALCWTLLALQSCPPGTEGLFSWAPISDIGLPEFTKFELPRTDSSCWKELFSYACIAECPPLQRWRYTSTQGLEIDFDHLLELAAVDYELDTSDGLLLFGFDTALIPLAPVESRCWHFIRTSKRQITPDRVKMCSIEGRFRGKLGPKYRRGFVYVGWCTSPVVKIGTEKPADDIFVPSDDSKVKKMEESVERSISKDGSIGANLGFLGAALRIAGGMRREKKIRQVALVARSTREKSFEDVLDSARATPCVLWDEHLRQGWLVSAVSVLLFASLRYVGLKHYSFKKRDNNGKITTASISYATPPNTTNSAKLALSALRNNQTLIVDTADGDIVNDEITFGAIMMRTWFEMEVGDDLRISKTTGKTYNLKHHLLGYHLDEAILGTAKHLRSLRVEHSIKSWEALAKAGDTKVIFCQNAGSVLECNSPTTSSLCCLRNRPQGSLSCLFQDLKDFYGGSWPRDFKTPIKRLPIGGEHVWTLQGYESLFYQSGTACSKHLQRITLKESKKERSQEKGAQGKENASTLEAFAMLERPVVIVFGLEG